MFAKHPSSLLLPLSLVLFLALIAVPVMAAAEGPPAGSVKNVIGEGQVAREGAAPQALKPGDRIFEKDVLTTGKDSTLGLTMRDNSVLSLGPGTRLVVERFMFAPERGELASIYRLTRGSLAGVSGEITKLKPESATVITPAFTLGIRGTHFLISVPPDQEEPDATTAAPTQKEGR